MSAPTPPAAPSSGPKTKLSGYQIKLFVFLSVATLFEGYDFFALAQVLDNIQVEFSLSKFEVTALTAFINAGTILAYLLVRKADRWGRKRVLTITILGYTLFTLLSGLSTTVWAFAITQFIARMFLIAEWATAMVYAAEEFPADRRGMVIGVLQAFSSLGAIVCAGVVPMLLKLSFDWGGETINPGWRSVYFVGVVPLLILAFARRNLKETTRFLEQKGKTAERPSFFAIWSGPYRRRVLELGAIWFVTYACTQNAVHFWKIFAKQDADWTDVEVAKALTIAAVVSLPLIFLSGKMLDVIGRRWGALIIYTSLIAGLLLAYNPDLPRLWLGLGLTVAVFGVTAVLSVLNAFTSELFPTELRGDAFAWTNNIIGRIGYVLSPLLIGVLAERLDSWGGAIRPTVIFPAIAMVLIWWLLPETKGKELEETAAADFGR
ncbi:MAG: MFS transporter [Deltaproteobacteria bacterium]|nr:MFS transporter [Deltaproteobacteria bacterium]